MNFNCVICHIDPLCEGEAAAWPPDILTDVRLVVFQAMHASSVWRINVDAIDLSLIRAEQQLQRAVA
jgi:hypothetical protein